MDFRNMHAHISSIGVSVDIVKDSLELNRLFQFSIA